MYNFIIIVQILNNRHKIIIVPSAAKSKMHLYGDTKIKFSVGFNCTKKKKQNSFGLGMVHNDNVTRLRFLSKKKEHKKQKK